MSALLACESIGVRYGNVQAVRELSLEVREGELVALVGANGAGKSTTLKAISGLLPLAAGRIVYDGRPTAGMAAERLVRLGLVHVPEGRHIFPGLTVRENLQVATAGRRDGRRAENADLERVVTLFPRLAERLNQRGWSLSGGEQQMLAVGRGLMSRPRILLLDEPSLGLAPRVVEELFSAVTAMNREGTTVLLVEQNSYLALQISTRAYVLENGRILLSGASAELTEDPRVKAAYLGG